MRGGFSGDTFYCGDFSININDIYSRNYWHFGAALLLVHIILFVVADLEIVITVVLL